MIIPFNKEVEASLEAEVVAAVDLVRSDAGRHVRVSSTVDRVLVELVDDDDLDFEKRHRTKNWPWISLLPEEVNKVAKTIVQQSGDFDLAAPASHPPGSKLEVRSSRRRFVLQLSYAVSDFRLETAVRLNNVLVKHAVAAGYEPPRPEILALSSGEAPQAERTWWERVKQWGSP